MKNIHADAVELREYVDHPETRNYAILAKHDHLRLKFYDGVVLAANDRLCRKLDSMGYRFGGVNFEAQIIVFEPRA